MLPTHCFNLLNAKLSAATSLRAETSRAPPTTRRSGVPSDPSGGWAAACLPMAGPGPGCVPVPTGQGGKTRACAPSAFAHLSRR